ncbi:MAG TPA: prepilin-type N-terminal cleavage/methylation domain-containing protein [Terriglobales bacterium]|nr:prepilin-type N-terminal cleavage/methylation domain-containing protein [Terriglobales bacterium]
MELRRRPGKRGGRQAGFSLLEVMIAIVVLAVGIVSLLGLFTVAVGNMQVAQEDLIARQKAAQALESVFAARDTAQLTYAQIQNVANGGVFLNGPQPLLQPGPDGIIGTADDVGPPDQIILPGPDGLLGTGDDVIVPLSGFTRQIDITQVFLPSGAVDPSLRQITVTISYATPQRGFRTYQVASYISSYR